MELINSNDNNNNSNNKKAVAVASTVKIQKSAGPPPDPLFILRGHSSEVNHIRFHKKDQDLLLSGGSDGEVKIWRLSKRRSEVTITHTGDALGGVVAVDSLSNGDVLSQGRDGFIKLWDLQRLGNTNNTISGRLASNNNMIEIKSILAAELFSFCKFAVYELNDDSKNVWVGIAREEPQSAIELWDLYSQKIVHILRCPTSEKTGLCMFLKIFKAGDSGDILVSASYENGCIYFWNVKTATLMFHARLDSDPVLCFDINNTHDKLISGSAGPNINIFQLDLRKLSCEMIKGIGLIRGGISGVEIRPDQKIFATSGWDHQLRIFHMKKHTPLAVLSNHTETLNSLAFSPFNQSLLASASKDKRIAIWSIY